MLRACFPKWHLQRNLAWQGWRHFQGFKICCGCQMMTCWHVARTCCCEITGGKNDYPSNPFVCWQQQFFSLLAVRCNRWASGMPFFFPAFQWMTHIDELPNVCVLIRCVLAQRIYQLGLPCLQSRPKNSGEYVTTAPWKKNVKWTKVPSCVGCAQLGYGRWGRWGESYFVTKKNWSAGEPQCTARMNHVHFACRPWMRRTYPFLPVPATTRPLKRAISISIFFSLWQFVWAMVNLDKVCLFCVHYIVEQMNGKCPACRQARETWQFLFWKLRAQPSWSLFVQDYVESQFRYDASPMLSCCSILQSLILNGPIILMFLLAWHCKTRLHWNCHHSWFCCVFAFVHFLICSIFSTIRKKPWSWCTDRVGAVLRGRAKSFREKQAEKKKATFAGILLFLAVFMVSFSLNHYFVLQTHFFFASYAHRYWFTYHQAHVSFVRSEFVGSINTPIWGWYEATRIAHHLCRSILCLQYFCLAGDATVMAGLCSHQGVKKDDKSRAAWNIWTGRAMFLEWWSPVGEIILQTYFPENADSFAQLQPFYQQKCKWLADEPMARSMKTVRTHMSRVKTVSKMWSAHQNGSALYVRPPK